MSKRLEVEISKLKEMVGILAGELDKANERIAQLENGNGRKSAKSHR